MPVSVPSGPPASINGRQPSMTRLSVVLSTVRSVTFDEMEAAPPCASRASRRRLAELIHVLSLPDLERVERIGEFWGQPETRTFGELLIDLEQDKAARAVVFGLLRDTGQR
jgi:hypothetical protein